MCANLCTHSHMHTHVSNQVLTYMFTKTNAKISILSFLIDPLDAKWKINWIDVLARNQKAESERWIE